MTLPNSGLRRRRVVRRAHRLCTRSSATFLPKEGWRTSVLHGAQKQCTLGMKECVCAFRTSGVALSVRDVHARPKTWDAIFHTVEDDKDC